MNDDLSLSSRPDLASERLLLRRPDDRDVDAIVGVVGDWDVARRLARVPHPYGPADAIFFLRHVVPAEWTWAITLRGSDQLLGAIGLTPEEGTDTAELGYWLSPAHWGNGIATEAARAVVAFGFERLSLPVVTSGYFEDNAASGQVLRKLGFVETGRVMRSCLAAGGRGAVDDDGAATSGIMTLAGRSAGRRSGRQLLPYRSGDRLCPSPGQRG